MKMNRMPGVMKEIKTQEIEVDVVKIVKKFDENVDWRNDGEVIDTFRFLFKFDTDTSTVELETYLLSRFEEFYLDSVEEFDSNRFITQVFHNEMAVYNPNTEDEIDLYVASLLSAIPGEDKHNVFTLKITHIADCKDCPTCRAKNKNKKGGKK